MAYNLKKMSKKSDEVSPLSVSLTENAKKYNLSIDEAKNVNSYLESDRRQNKNGPQTHESMLDSVRKEAKAGEKTLEGALSDAKSPLYPHRQYQDGNDKFDVTPISMISEAYDQKWRESFSKVNKSNGTEFWDKYINKDLDDKPTKVHVNVPISGSQLQNKADRFKNLNSLPTHAEAEKNRDNFGKKNEVDRMHFAKTKQNVKIAVASLQEADKALFAIHYMAANENRELNNEEKTIIASINKDKEKYLITLADNNMFDNPGSYRGDKDLQRDLFSNDPFAADPQRVDSIEDDEYLGSIIDDEDNDISPPTTDDAELEHDFPNGADYDDEEEGSVADIDMGEFDAADDEFDDMRFMDFNDTDDTDIK